MRTLVVVAAGLLAVSGSAETRRTAQKPGSPPAPEKSAELLPFQATEKTLPNGLKVIVVPTGFPNIVSLQIPVQTGSRNEVEPGKSGFAHFFEHMMFRGTEAYPPEKYQEIMTKAGARQNAYTTDDYTNYHITFAKEDLETILEIEADRFQNLSYSGGGLQDRSARGARRVQQEQRRTRSTSSSRCSATTPSRRTPTSTPRWASSRTSRTCRTSSSTRKTFFERWYRPEYTTLIVAGDVDRGARCSRSSRSTGAAGSAGSSRTSTSRRSRQPKGPVYAHVPGRRRRCPGSRSRFHGPAFSETEKDFAALDMLLDL